MLLRAAAFAAVLVAAVAAADGRAAEPGGRLVYTQSTIQIGQFDDPIHFLCTSGPDGSGASRITEPDWKLWGEPAFSPDGSRLAFVNEAGGALRALIVADADGTDWSVLVDDAAWAAFSPDWSPDGRTIFFERDGDIHAVSWPEAARRRVTATPVRRELYPSVSPDGARLAFAAAATREHDPEELVVSDVDGGSERIVARRPELRSPDWSPDGTRIVFQAQGRIWTVGADGSDPRDLGVGAAPSYAPDGTRIAFLRGGDVWTMRADGGDPRRVTFTPSPEGAPAWQPVGARFAAAGAKPCILSGTTGDDVIEGTPFPDLIYDVAGDDVIRGLGEHDVVLDGPGDDRIDGGDASDFVLLEAGRNVVRGGPGNDIVTTRSLFEPQVILGEGGNDNLDGGNGADRIDGGAGNDGILGSAGLAGTRSLAAQGATTSKGCSGQIASPGAPATITCTAAWKQPGRRAWTAPT